MIPSSRQSVATTLLVGVALTATTASAQLSEAAIDERLRFLEDRLDAERTHAAYWQWGWMGVRGGGTIASALLATERDGDDQADDIVNATTNGIRLMALLLRPIEARLGTHAIRSMPTHSVAQKQNKLLVAEALLERNAERARERTSWRAHLTNLAFNAAAFGFIAGFGNMEDAAISGGSGAVAGSLQLWSQPGRATRDWLGYQALRNKITQRERPSWRVLSGAGGIAFQYDF